jgi:hypothetical protein
MTTREPGVAPPSILELITRFEWQIAATDGQIDRLVYDLYGLTADEVQIVEGRPS